MRQLHPDCGYYRYELRTELAQDDQDLGRGSYYRTPKYSAAQSSSHPLETPIKPLAGTTNTFGMRTLNSIT